MSEMQRIKDWISAYLARTLEVAPDLIDPELQFDEYGIDSRTAAELIGALGEWLGRDLDPSIIYDYPSIDELSQHLSTAAEVSPS
ncbi:MAG: acyl carrier protein [Wenzhouxiangellaceae bacterium]